MGIDMLLKRESFLKYPAEGLCVPTGYLYETPIPNEVAYNPYEGKSLQEIREEFGDKASRDVYWLACSGIDLTKSSLISGEVNKEVVFDWVVDKFTHPSGYVFEASFLPNSFSSYQKSTMFSTLYITHTLSAQIGDEIVTQMLIKPIQNDKQKRNNTLGSGFYSGGDGPIPS